jgi:hypothetical protein
MHPAWSSIHTGLYRVSRALACCMLAFNECQASQSKQAGTLLPDDRRRCMSCLLRLAFQAALRPGVAPARQSDRASSDLVPAVCRQPSLQCASSVARPLEGIDQLSAGIVKRRRAYAHLCSPWRVSFAGKPATTSMLHQAGRLQVWSQRSRKPGPRVLALATSGTTCVHRPCRAPRQQRWAGLRPTGRARKAVKVVADAAAAAAGEAYAFADPTRVTLKAGQTEVRHLWLCICAARPCVACWRALACRHASMALHGASMRAPQGASAGTGVRGTGRGTAPTRQAAASSRHRILRLTPLHCAPPCLRSLWKPERSAGRRMAQSWHPWARRWAALECACCSRTAAATTSPHWSTQTPPGTL